MLAFTGCSSEQDEIRKNNDAKSSAVPKAQSVKSQKSAPALTPDQQQAANLGVEKAAQANKSLKEWERLPTSSQKSLAASKVLVDEAISGLAKRNAEAKLREEPPQAANGYTYDSNGDITNHPDCPDGIVTPSTGFATGCKK